MSDAVEAARRIAREFVDLHPEGCRFYENLPHGDAMDVCRALLAAVEGSALTPRDERDVTDNGWLPIETAPKDGTDILLYAPVQMFNGSPTEERVTVGHWTQDEECRTQIGDCGGECRCPEYEYDDPCWMSWDGGFIPENPPTRWKPLPAPPKDEQSSMHRGEAHPSLSGREGEK